MENNRKPVLMSDNDYARYLKNAEEMEKLILDAANSYRQIEQIRKQSLGNIGRIKRIQLTKRKHPVRISVK